MPTDTSYEPAASAGSHAAPADAHCSHPSFDREKVEALRTALPSRGRIDGAVELLAALSNRTRFRIVHALQGGQELCVCDVAHLVGSSVSKASHHLGRLRAAGVVTFRNDGRMAYYRLAEPRAEVLLGTAMDARRIAIDAQRSAMDAERSARPPRTAAVNADGGPGSRS